MTEPLISIIIPTFNRYSLLGETLDSVINQSYQNWECIVVDDDSKDYTRELMKFYVEKDSRIILLKRPIDKKKGAASCRNLGIGKSKGDFVQFLDSDDLLHQEKLEKQIALVKDKNKGTIFTCRFGYFTRNDDLLEKLKKVQKTYRDFRKPFRLLYYFGKYQEFLPIHAYLIHREVINKAGSWNEQLSNNDDAEFMSRVIINSKKIVFVSDAYVFYRLDGQNELSAFKTKENAESAIMSLKLITEHLEKKYPRTCKKYVSQSKKYVLSKIENNFPDLVQIHSKFFTH